MSKADLELHVVKLERSVARLRKQNAELKQAAHDEAQKAPVARPATRTKRATAPKARRQSIRHAEAPMPDEDDGGSTPPDA